MSASIHTERDQTVITGGVVDQSHLQRILDSISDLKLELVTLERLEPVAPPPAG